jgi:hypothetical protein
MPLEGGNRQRYAQPGTPQQIIELQEEIQTLQKEIPLVGSILFEWTVKGFESPTVAIEFPTLTTITSIQAFNRNNGPKILVGVMSLAGNVCTFKLRSLSEEAVGTKSQLDIWVKGT